MDSFYCQLKNQWNLPKIAILPTPDNLHCRSSDYYQYKSFRTLICEMIYQAVNLFPEIEEYTITCTAGKMISSIQLGEYPDNIIGKITNGDLYCDVSKMDMVKLYVANRTTKPDDDRINTITQILYYSGKYAPTISTSMVFSDKSGNK